MKTKLNYIYLLFTVFVLASCSKSVDVPDISFTASKTSVAVGDTVTFTINGLADGFAIYTGDNGHEYEKSRAALTPGKDITTEVVYLTQAKFDEMKAEAKIRDNITPERLGKIQAMIGKHYDGMSHVEELIREYHNYEITPGITGYSVADITAFFTVEALPLPEDGYATGVGIDPNAINKTYSYKYPAAGTYTVTLVATSVGRKNYSGSGYKNARITYDSEYDRTVVTMNITITVN
ncbi:MAG: DUF5017 domain-containing protein [Niabella sp.]